MPADWDMVQFGTRADATRAADLVTEDLLYKVQMPVFDCGAAAPQSSAAPFYGGSGGFMVSASGGKLARILTHVAQHAVTDPSMLFSTENSTSVPPAATANVYSLLGVLDGSDGTLAASPCSS